MSDNDGGGWYRARNINNIILTLMEANPEMSKEDLINMTAFHANGPTVKNITSRVEAFWSARILYQSGKIIIPDSINPENKRFVDRPALPKSTVPDTIEIPDKISEKKDTGELSKPPVPTKTIRLGSHKKQVPVKQEPVPEEVPEDPADPVPEPSMAYLQHEAEQHQEDPVPEPEPLPEPLKAEPVPAKLYEQPVPAPVPIQKRNIRHVPPEIEKMISDALREVKAFGGKKIVSSHKVAQRIVEMKYPDLSKTTPGFTRLIAEIEIPIRAEIARQEEEGRNS